MGTIKFKATVGGNVGRPWPSPATATGPRKRTPLLASIAVALLVACGGATEGTAPSASTEQLTQNNAEMPAQRAAAARFLTQATFGPTDAEVERVMAMGYGAWIDDQWAKPVSGHRVSFEAMDAAAKAAGSSSVWQDGTINSFWKHALRGEDQLRQRVAYAWSQIMVISMQDGGVGDNPRAVSAYLDMLADKGLGTYRDLLEGVALHPMMGVYLSHLKNQKADARTGRVPDENFAREVMQLFSIGLHELNADGSPRMNGAAPVETYTDKDIGGLAKVFTGFSWSCPDWPDNNCFHWGSVNNVSDPDRTFKPMMGYPQFHSVDEKQFLSKTIATQSQSSPSSSLKDALDALAAHPNVGPFIGKQLIQRLVTSNPSPAYVASVAAVFQDNGSGVRGDLKAVVKAILMHPEARVANERSGKVREPVLRMTAFMRAFGHASTSGDHKMGNTDNPGSSLGQTPMRSPSVFNFYRPGYVSPGSMSAAASLVTPELQIVHETTAAGYVNYVRDAITQGAGQWVNNRRDLQADYAALMAQADRVTDLVEAMNQKLMYGTMPAALKTEIEGAVTSFAIPTLNATGSNQSSIDTARRNRVHTAIFLTLVSPEYQVQR